LENVALKFEKHLTKGMKDDTIKWYKDKVFFRKRNDKIHKKEKRGMENETFL